MPGVKLTPIQPKKRPFGSPQQLQKLVDAVLDEQVDEAKALVDKVTDTWSAKSKPTVTVRKSRSERTMTIKGDIYRYVDEGTRAHIIKARKARFLRFNGSFSPKSRPGTMASYKGSKGGPVIHRRQVRHPGSQARGFTKKIGELQQRSFPKRFRQALKLYFGR